MEKIPNNIVSKKEEERKGNDIEIKSVEKEKLEEIKKEYEQDPDNFYRKNAFVLWDEGKNPALMISVEMASKFIREVWEEKNLGNPTKILNESRNIAMFVMKYLGADIEGWCKVDPKTAVEVNQQMGKNDFQENCKLILEKIKRNDPVFSEFLTKVCVRDLKTGELRKENEMVAIVTVVNLIVRTMYEQMLKDAKIN